MPDKNEYVECSTAFVFKNVSTEKGVDFFIKGFASIEGVDRHGEEIPAAAFDVQSFMSNPQLWLNHDLFESKSGIFVPVGVVEQMHIVQVKEKKSGVFDLVDEGTGKSIDTVSEVDGFILSNGDKGLWVVAKIQENDISELVTDGRLNAFSWAGTILRKPNGKIASIDIREVSVVFLPANARALFTVGKDATQKDTKVLIKDGVVHICSDGKFEYDRSRNGARYAFLCRSSKGKTHLIEPKEDITTEDEMKTLAQKYADDSYQVVVYANDWKKDDSGCQLYTCVHFVEGIQKDTDVPVGIERDYSTDNDVWPVEYIKALPDSSFAYVAPDGERFFPYRDVDGGLDSDAIKCAIRRACNSPFHAVSLDKLKHAAIDAGLHDWIVGGGQSPLTKTEQKLLGVSGEFPIQNKSQKEGENMDEVLEALKGMTTSIDTMSDRLDAIESQKTEDSDTSATKEAEKEEVSEKDVDTEKASDEATKEVVKEKETEKEDKASDEMLVILKMVADKIDGVSDRVSKLEDSPVASKQLSESDKDESGAAEVTASTVQKAYDALPTADKKRVSAIALDDVIFGGVREQHENL